MIDPAAVQEFLAAHDRGVLTTIKRDGRPQSSVIVYGLIDGRVHISVTASRAKTHNARRDPRVSMLVTKDFGAHLIVEGTASLSEVTTDPADDAADLLVATYRSIAGDHPDWDEYRQAMIDQRRLVLSFDIEHAYGMGVG